MISPVAAFIRPCRQAWPVLLCLSALGLGSCATTGTTVPYEDTQELSAISAAELYRLAAQPGAEAGAGALAALARTIEGREGVPDAVVRHRQASKQRAVYRETRKLLRLGKLGDLPGFGKESPQLDARGRDALFDAGVNFTASEKDAALVIAVAPVGRCPRARRTYLEAGDASAVLSETILVPKYTLYDVACDPEREAMSFVLDELLLTVGDDERDRFSFAVLEDSEVEEGSYSIAASPVWAGSSGAAAEEGQLERVVAHLETSGSFQGVSLSGSGKLTYSSAGQTVEMGLAFRDIELQAAVDKLAYLVLQHAFRSDPVRSVELDDGGTASLRKTVLGGTSSLACTVGSPSQAGVLLASGDSLVACQVAGVDRACHSSCDLSGTLLRIFDQPAVLEVDSATEGKSLWSWSKDLGPESDFVRVFGADSARTAEELSGDLEKELLLDVRLTLSASSVRFVDGQSRATTTARVAVEWASPQDRRGSWLLAHRRYAELLLEPPRARYDQLTFEDDAALLSGALLAPAQDARLVLDSLYCRKREPRVSVPEIPFIYDKVLCKTLNQLDVAVSEKYLASRIAALQKVEDKRLAAIEARTFVPLAEILGYLKKLALPPTLTCADGDEFERRQCMKYVKSLRPVMVRWLKNNRLIAELGVAASQFDFSKGRFLFTLESVEGADDAGIFPLAGYTEGTQWSIGRPRLVYTGTQKCGTWDEVKVPVHQGKTFFSPRMSAAEAEDSPFREVESGTAIVSLLPQTKEICCTSDMRRIIMQDYQDYQSEGVTCTYYPYVAKIHELMLEEEALLGFRGEYFERSLRPDEVDSFDNP